MKALVTHDFRPLRCPNCEEPRPYLVQRQADVTMCPYCWNEFDDDYAEWANGRDACERGDPCPEGASTLFKCGYGTQYTYEQQLGGMYD